MQLPKKISLYNFLLMFAALWIITTIAILTDPVNWQDFINNNHVRFGDEFYKVSMPALPGIPLAAMLYLFMRGLVLGGIMRSLVKSFDQ